MFLIYSKEIPIQFQKKCFFVAAVVILRFVDLLLDLFVDFCWVMLAFIYGFYGLVHG